MNCSLVTSLCISQQNKRRDLELAYPCMTEMGEFPLLLTGLMLACMQSIISGEISESKPCIAKEGVQSAKIMVHCTAAYGRWPSTEAAEAKTLPWCSLWSSYMHSSPLHCEDHLRNKRFSEKVWSKYSTLHKVSCQANIHMHICVIDMQHIPFLFMTCLSVIL